MKPSFRKRFTLSERRQEYDRIERHRAHKIPVVVECGSSSTPQIDKEKFLLPLDLTIAQFAFVIRRRIALDAGMGLFLLINNKLCKASSTMSELYVNNRSEDGFMYVTYTVENTFG